MVYRTPSVELVYRVYRGIQVYRHIRVYRYTGYTDSKGIQCIVGYTGYTDNWVYRVYRYSDERVYRYTGYTDYQGIQRVYILPRYTDCPQVYRGHINCQARYNITTL